MCVYARLPLKRKTPDATWIQFSHFLLLTTPLRVCISFGFVSEMQCTLTMYAMNVQKDQITCVHFHTQFGMSSKISKKWVRRLVELILSSSCPASLFLSCLRQRILCADNRSPRYNRTTTRPSCECFERGDEKCAVDSIEERRTGRMNVSVLDVPLNRHRVYTKLFRGFNTAGA